MENKKQDKGYKPYLWIIIILLVAIAVILLLRPCNCGNYGYSDLGAEENVPKSIASFFGLGVDQNAKDGEIQKKSQEEIQEELNKKLEDGMINMTINPNPVFENGTSEGNLRIQNKAINNYPQVVQIYRDDTGELIYQSALIPVDSNIENAKLDVELSAGEYNCTAYFNSVDAETGNVLGQGAVKIVINVLR